MKKLRVIAITSTFFVFGLLSAAVPAEAQLKFPTGSQTDFLFAHLTDGGPATGRWTTLIRIVNPNSFATTGTVYFYGQNGSPLAVDLGGGPNSFFSITIAPSGSFVGETTGAPSSLRIGWAFGSFDAPVKATEEFRFWRSGAFANGASVDGIQEGWDFWTSGDYYTGVAIANPSSSVTTSCTASFLSSTGTVVSQQTISLSPLNQTAFNVGPKLSLLQTAVGSFWLGCNYPVASLAIWGNNTGITSSLPSGAVAAPTYQSANIQRIFKQLVKALNTSANGALAVGTPGLQILSGTVLNAFAFNGSVYVELGLAELISDSPSELAAVLAHELGHIHQQLYGSNPFNANPELDADEFSIFALLSAGYDPYAPAGFLGKLMMLSKTTGILTQVWENLYDVHTSIPNRMSNIYQMIQNACSVAFAACQQIHNIEHPHLNAPLISKPEENKQ